MPLVTGNQEILLFVDDERGFSLHETVLSDKTNYGAIVVSHFEEAREFLGRACFPSHGLIVRPNQWRDKSVIFKGLQDTYQLESAIATCSKKSDDRKVRIETDMRACLNPTRMSLIGELAHRLAKRLASQCPACCAPGWGVVDMVRGLRCEQCGAPTEMVAYEAFGCVLCHHRQYIPIEHWANGADQMYCHACNP